MDPRSDFTGSCVVRFTCTPACSTVGVLVGVDSGGLLHCSRLWLPAPSGNLELSVSCVSISCVLLCLDKTQKLYVAYPYLVSYCVLMIVCNIQCQHTNSQHTTTYRVNTHCPHTPHTSARYSNQDTILKTHSNIQCQHTDAELYCVLMLYVIVCGCVFIMCVNVC